MSIPNLEDCLLVPKARLYLSGLGDFAARVALNTMGAHHFTIKKSLERVEESLHHKYSSAPAYLEGHGKNSFGQGKG